MIPTISGFNLTVTCWFLQLRTSSHLRSITFMFFDSIQPLFPQWSINSWVVLEGCSCHRTYFASNDVPLQPKVILEFCLQLLPPPSALIHDHLWCTWVLLYLWNKAKFSAYCTALQWLEAILCTSTSMYNNLCLHIKHN